MSNRKLPILIAGAFLFAAAPAMAQGTTNTIPAKPTGKSDIKPNGAMKAKTLPNGAETEGRSGATDSNNDMSTTGTSR